MTDRHVHGTFEGSSWRFIDNGDPFHPGITPPILQEIQRHRVSPHFADCSCSTKFSVDEGRHINPEHIDQHLASHISALVAKMLADAYNEGLDDQKRYLDEKLQGRQPHEPTRR